MSLETPQNDPREDTPQLKLSEEIYEHLIMHDALSKLGDPEEPVSERLYLEPLQDNWQFGIFVYDKDGERCIVFEMKQDGDETRPRPAELIFKCKPDCYFMYHRLVQTQELGVTGTDMLKKAEAFFSYLFDHGYVPVKDFLINAGQEQVINWAMKNSYEFKDVKDEKGYELLTGDSPHVVYNVSIPHPTDGYMRSGYVLPKALYEEMQELSEKEIFEQARRFEQGAVRINLIKKNTVAPAK